ncbi:MAG TPA: ABC transporter substrate-binding protein [Pseudonocardiaceae bacterium]|nr:ABC transporter substrate-binding protein [Pseudonocardiaceae bacterium]
MSRRAVRAVVALAAALSLLAAGCGGEQRDPGVASSGTPARPAGYPVQIQNCGRTLTFEEPPQRVVTGYQPVLEVMAGLGLADKVIGRTTYAGSLLPDQKADIERIPIVSSSNSLPPREELLALTPDLVYSTGYSDFEAASGQATVDDLAAVGTQAYLGGGACSAAEADAATLEDTYADILNMGRIFGVTERAQQAVDRMKATVAQARAAVAAEPPVPVAFYSSGTGPLRLAGAGLNTDIIKLAGGRNVFADQEVYFEADRESVLGAGPDTMIISDYRPGASAAEKAAFLSQTFPELAARWQKPWPVIDAVYTHPGWRHADAIALLARQLHPNAFD